MTATASALGLDVPPEDLPADEAWSAAKVDTQQSSSVMGWDHHDPSRLRLLPTRHLNQLIPSRSAGLFNVFSIWFGSACSHAMAYSSGPTTPGCQDWILSSCHWQFSSTASAAQLERLKTVLFAAASSS